MNECRVGDVFRISIELLEAFRASGDSSALVRLKEIRRDAETGYLVLVVEKFNNPAVDRPTGEHHG